MTTTSLTGRDSAVPSARRSVLVMAGLYLLAAAVRLVAASQIPMPSIEPSAYDADVAGSLASGADLLAPGVLDCLDGPPVPLERTQTTAWLIRLSGTCAAT